MKLHIVPARAGLEWVRLGIRVFWRQPMALAALFFMTMMAMSIATLLPLVGPAVALALLPSATLAMMVAAGDATQGRFPTPALLLVAFRTGRQRLRSMLLLGALYALGFLAVMGISALLDGGQFARVYLGGEELTREVAELPHCIPSKALLHVAAVIDEVSHLKAAGIEFGAPKVDIDTLRGHKEKVIGKLTGGLAAMAKMRKVTTVRGVGQFVGANHLEVEETTGAKGQEKTGSKKVVAFKRAIIAAGSQAVHLPFVPQDPRIVDSTGALELRQVPKRMLVIGGGIIGLEMATVYSTLGARMTVVEMMDGLMQGADRDLVKPLADRLKKQGVEVHLKTKATDVKADKAGITVSFEAAVEGEKPGLDASTFDRVLVAVGRSPNGKKIDAEKAGVQVTDRGFIPADRQMRTNVPHIFAIGDIVGNPMLAHKATHEGKLAAEVAAGEKKEWVARVIPSVAYTNPEIAWVGVTETEAKAKGLKVGVAKFPWAASGRAIGIGRTEGFTKLIFDEETHRIIGGAIVGVHAGDLLAEIGLAIEMGAEAEDIGHTIHAHPTLSESVAMAAEIYDGTITDLYMPKKK